DRGAGTGGINCDRGSLQVQVIGDARRDDGASIAPECLLGWLGAEQFLVIATDAAHVHAATPAPGGVTGITAILQGLPGLFKEEALLGIHVFCFEGGDFEEEWVELIDMIEEATMLAIGPVLRRGTGEVGSEVPARYLPD